MRLTSCSSCSTLLPPFASSCPECGVARVMPRVLKGAAAIGAGALLSMTLSACYGGPVEPIDRDSGPPPAMVDSGPDDAGS